MANRLTRNTVAQFVRSAGPAGPERGGLRRPGSDLRREAGLGPDRESTQPQGEYFTNAIASSAGRPGGAVRLRVRLS